MSEETGLKLETVRSRRAAARRERGVILIILTLAFSLLVPLIGLAFDCGMLYLVRTRLSAAVDAAVLAGGRSLSRGQDVASQEAHAIQIATDYFNANFPANLYGTTNIVFNTTVTELADRRRLVAMNASVDAPLYFLRVLRRDYTNVRVSAVASRRDVNLILVLDRSTSMSGAMTAMKAAARAFVDKFAEDRDNVGLVVFGGSSLVAFPSPSPNGPESNFKTASPNVDTLISQMTNGGNTGTAQAIWLAYQELVKCNQPGALNVIVFFTDGLPNGLVGEFNDPDPAKNLLKSTSLCTYRLQPSRPMLGFLSQWSNFAPTGTTVGIKKLNASTVSSIDEGPIQTNSNGCAYRSDQTKMRQDVARMPNPDYYGNATSPGIRTVNLSRVDSPQQIGYASLNAADSAVQRIRQDQPLSIIIYSIGYFGGSEQPDEVWLKRIANDPSSSDFDATKPVGLYVKAPTTGQLGDAFARIASEILRLSQ